MSEIIVVLLLLFLIVRSQQKAPDFGKAPSRLWLGLLSQVSSTGHRYRGSGHGLQEEVVPRVPLRLVRRIQAAQRGARMTGTVTNNGGPQRVDVGDWIEVERTTIFVPDDQGNSPDPIDYWEAAEVTQVDANGQPAEVKFKSGQTIPLLPHLVLRKWRRITS
jgi:hypothetical protein